MCSLGGLGGLGGLGYGGLGGLGGLGGYGNLGNLGLGLGVGVPQQIRYQEINSVPLGLIQPYGRNSFSSPTLFVIFSFQSLASDSVDWAWVEDWAGMAGVWEATGGLLSASQSSQGGTSCTGELGGWG